MLAIKCGIFQWNLYKSDYPTVSAIFAGRFYLKIEILAFVCGRVHALFTTFKATGIFHFFHQILGI